jgi:adenylylsulfate kinase
VNGGVVWLTGLPQSGKSTLAARVRDALERPSCILDSDELRQAIAWDRGYGERDRDDFYTALANLAALLARQGLVVLVPATANRRRYRERARQLAPRFLEVWIDAPAEVCAARDQKRLYRDRPAGLPGAGADYEPPAHPDVVAAGGKDDAALAAILERLGRWPQPSPRSPGGYDLPS